jgi:hypothetical protein
MKRIVVLCSVVMLQGLDAFGQTNAVAPTNSAVSQFQWQDQKTPIISKAASEPVVPPPGTLFHDSKAQTPRLAKIHRIEREGVLIPNHASNDPGAALDMIFWSPWNPLEEMDIRDTVVTIYPPGR